MKVSRIATALLIGSVALVGCDDDDDDVVGVDDNFDTIAGDFSADSFVYSDVNDPTVTRDLVAEGGIIDLSIQDDGTFQSSYGEPGQPVFTNTGTVAFQDDDTLQFSDDPFLADDVINPVYYDYGVDDFGLTLSSTADRFDVDADGTLDDAMFEGTFAN